TAMPQGRPEIIELLNDVLTAELTAINQYFGHYRILGNSGFERLAARGRAAAIDETKPADELIDRSPYLEGHAKRQRPGRVRPGARAREASIDEMKHADEVIGRILYLEGHPNLQRRGPVRLGEDPVETLRLDLELEHEAVDRLNRGIALAVELGDNGTRELL